MAKRSTAKAGKGTKTALKPTQGKKLRGNNGTNRGHDNIKGQGFHTNPERINMKGRPPKLIHHITEEYRAQGYEPVTEGQIIDAYQMLLQLGEAEVKKVESDKSKPFFLRLVAKWMQSQRGMEMLDRVMDRSFGKVLQRQQVDATVHSMPEPEVKSEDQAAILKEVMNRLDALDK